MYTLPTVYKIIIAVSFSVITTAVIIIPRLRVRGTALLILTAISAAAIFSALYFDVIFYPDKHYGEESEIVGKIVDEESSASGTKEVIVKVKYINGKRSFYKFKGFVYTDTDAAKVGSEITFSAKILDFDTTETFDYKNYYSKISNILCVIDLVSFILHVSIHNL